MPGPRPDPSRPYSRHRPRGVQSALTMLPAGGCDLPPPTIPNVRKWSRYERRLWRELWASPQATQWDDSNVLAVAMLIVHFTAVLSGSAAAWQAQEARHLADRLGLTPEGAKGLGWRLDGADEAPMAGVLTVLPGGVGA